MPNKPYEWKTFQGKPVSIDTIDHQHLSNCYWFAKIVHQLEDDHSHIELIKSKLADRFNGQLLPYRPHTRFKLELNYLKLRGFLKYKILAKDSLTKEADIIFNGVKVGEISEPI